MSTLTHQARVPFVAFVRHLFIWVIAALIVTLLPFSGSGQTVTGSISGTVTDPNGAIVAGAAVTLENDQTKDRRDQVSNEAGRFSFAAVQPGIYSENRTRWLREAAADKSCLKRK